MPRPTETALRGRARALLEAMTQRARWIYAIPRDRGGAVEPILGEGGLHAEERDAKAGAARFTDGRGTTTFVLLDSAELDVLLVEAAGPAAPALLAKILERTGFYAQSELLGTALDLGNPEAGLALRTLAHMVVGWDEDWSDLFLLHLASPDAVVRHDATVALGIAVLVAGSAGPARALLGEAISRERFPKLKETMTETLNLVLASAGLPVELAP